MNNQVNSHIQMPKFFLKRFENEKHRLFCYDIAEERIIISDAGHTNTETGYYSENVEKILNQAIEQPFSVLLRFIDTIDFDSPRINAKRQRDLVEKTRLFMNALLARSPNMYKGMMKNSIFQHFLDCQSQRNLSAIQGINEANKLGCFEDYFPTFTVNRSNLPFVVPVCGLYFYNQNKNINLPIRPDLAITMVNGDMLEKLTQNGRIGIYLVEKDSEANRLNYFAFQEQKQQKYGMVVSSSPEPLKRMFSP